MMRYLSIRSLLMLAVIVGVMSLSPHAGHAASASGINSAAKAALEKLYTETPAAKQYGDKAKGILVFPEVTKAGLVVGGSSGDGVLMVDGKPVGYYNTSSGSIGLQAGYEEHSEVMMFMTDEALTKFKASSGWEVGVDAGVTVIDTGAAGSVSTEDMKENPVVAFIFGQEGLMGGISLEGAKLSKIENLEP